MKVRKGKNGCFLSHQDEFPATTPCSCGGLSRIALVVKEETEEEFYVCDLHENKGKGGFWPHDAIAVAVYFCENCLKPVILFNQA